MILTRAAASLSIAFALLIGRPADLQTHVGTPAPPDRISIEFNQTDIADAFRTMGDLRGVNIVLFPEVHGTISMTLKDVTWWQAFEAMLRLKGLRHRVDGNVIYIQPL